MKRDRQRMITAWSLLMSYSRSLIPVFVAWFQLSMCAGPKLHLSRFYGAQLVSCRCLLLVCHKTLLLLVGVKIYTGHLPLPPTRMSSILNWFCLLPVAPNTLWTNQIKVSMSPLFPALHSSMKHFSSALDHVTPERVSFGATGIQTEWYEDILHTNLLSTLSTSYFMVAPGQM